MSLHSELNTTNPAGALSAQQLAEFQQQGFVVVRGLTDSSLVARMREVTDRGLAGRIGPVEYEAELQYPGAPASLSARGGETIRRLKQAFTRDFCFAEWMLTPRVLTTLQQLVGTRVICPLAHHNCIMTKQPRFSSETGWHQDLRYWSFTRPELVNAWLALGPETLENGCLKVIPGSHRAQFQSHQFDEALFFDPAVPDNQPWLARAQQVELQAGDVLFFHCLTLHAAGRNQTNDTKYSVVFTFRPADNPPLPGTRSASLPELVVNPA